MKGVIPMYIDTDSIITTASLIAAVVAIFSSVFAIYRWYLKQNKQDTEIKAIKEEQCVICYALLACLDGLKQLGANGNVSDGFSKLEEHLNKHAHD